MEHIGNTTQIFVEDQTSNRFKKNIEKKIFSNSVVPKLKIETN